MPDRAPHPVTGPEIIAALDSNARTIVEYFGTIPDPQFFTGDPEHWGPGHHLTHLTQTSTAVTRGLRSASLPPYAAARSRTYAEVRDAAAASLAATPRPKLLEMGRVVVIAPGTSRGEVIAAFDRASAGLRAAAGTWAEEALDRHTMAHPLIGSLTVREMLYFMVVHERHHLKLVRSREAAWNARATG